MNRRCAERASRCTRSSLATQVASSAAGGASPSSRRHHRSARSAHAERSAMVSLRTQTPAMVSAPTSSTIVKLRDSQRHAPYSGIARPSAKAPSASTWSEPSGTPSWSPISAVASPNAHRMTTPKPSGTRMIRVVRRILRSCARRISSRPSGRGSLYGSPLTRNGDWSSSLTARAASRNLAAVSSRGPDHSRPETIASSSAPRGLAGSSARLPDRLAPRRRRAVCSAAELSAGAEARRAAMRLARAPSPLVVPRQLVLATRALVLVRRSACVADASDRAYTCAKGSARRALLTGGRCRAAPRPSLYLSAASRSTTVTLPMCLAASAFFSIAL